MSRLDRFIKRMQAQRALLDQVCIDLNAPGALPGAFIELGLGNARTYDHVRERLIGRRIVVFDRSAAPKHGVIPLAADFFVGDIRDTARIYVATNGQTAAVVHADLGDGSAAYNADIQSWLPDTCCLLLQPGGLVLSSTPLNDPRLRQLDVTPDATAGGYTCYRAG
jgi:S-adenosyl-L-methionine methyltransferase